MKILILGGAGFVGSALANELNKEHEVTVLDTEINGDKNRLDSDISFNTLPTLDEFNYVYYLACSQISKSDKDPFLDVDNNSLDLLRILEHYKNNPSKNLKKIIYTSSCSVFGNNNEIITEQSPIDICSTYAATKYLSENYCKLYHKNYGLPISIVRYSNVYGYNQHPPFTCGVVGKFIYNAYNNIPLELIDNTSTRDYTFIDDAIEATIKVALSDSIGDDFNIATNKSHTVEYIADVIENYKAIIKKPFDKRIIDNVSKRQISYNKINLMLDWKPKYNLEQGIAKIIEHEYSSSN